MRDTPDYLRAQPRLSPQKLEAYDRLGSRGELAKTVMNLVEERLIGTSNSVHGKLVALKQQGKLEDDESMFKSLVEFRKNLYGTLRGLLRLSDADWEAIEAKRHQEWLDAPSTG